MGDNEVGKGFNPETIKQSTGINEKLLVVNDSHEENNSLQRNLRGVTAMENASKNGDSVPPSAPFLKIETDYEAQRENHSNYDGKRNKNRKLSQTAGSCNNPFLIGEIRNWRDKSQCIDPRWYDGQGDVGTYNCDGYSDQIFKFCEDGTIRSSKSGFCLDVSGYDGKGNVQMWSCETYPTVSEDQQWDIIRVRPPLHGSGYFTDSGVSQDLFRIKNRDSGYCLDIDGYDGRGNVQTYRCDYESDQLFYVRSRGEVVGHGKLQNQKSGNCLDVSGYNGHGNVQTWNCQDEADQVFTLYKNGELVNADSNWCVDISGYDGNGNIGTYACEAKADQQWKQVLWSGDYFSLASKKSNKCVDVAWYDGSGNIGTWDCQDLPDQKWKWIAETWTSPVGSWNQVYCNMNGGIKQTIQTSVSSSSSLTSTTSIEIATEIETGVIFKKAKVSTKVSQSFAKTWTSSSSSSNSVAVSCDVNDDGSDFTGGCLWQWHLSTSSSKINNVSWRAGISKCTHSTEEPNCPPFTKCANADCTICESY